MVVKKKVAKKVAKKPVKKAAKKAPKKVVKAVKKPAKKVVKKDSKTVAVKVVTDKKGAVTVTSVDDPGTATEGEVASVKPHVDDTGVLVMVPDSE